MLKRSAVTAWVESNSDGSIDNENIFSHSHIATDDQTVSQSVSLGIEHPPRANDQIFIAPRLLRF
jgi:hypothetical protein